MRHSDEVVGDFLARWVRGVEARARTVVSGIFALTLLFGAYAALNLGINSDNTRMVAEDLPSSRLHRAFHERFPILDNALLVVIDAETPAAAREASRQLAERIAADPAHFRDVYRPGGGEFFERNGLLYRSVEELEEFADEMARAQPILVSLDHDPSIANFAALMRLGLGQATESGRSQREWALFLDRVEQATVAAYDEVPIQTSWDEVFLRGSALELATRQVLVVDPVLDFANLLPAGGALGAIEAAARDLGLSEERGVRVRVTGNPALNHEEMLGLAWDIGVAGVFCFLLVAAVIARAFRSLRLAAASLVTLVVGLVWTAAFAAAAVGQLNLVSITFAILFIGLGVDFAIHLGTRYAALRREDTSHGEALQTAARGVGSSLVLCTVTTAIGFYVFVPTDYRGVAELGLIAGTGMFVSLFMTLTLLPALLSSWLPFDPAGRSARELRFTGNGFEAIERRAGAIRLAALALAVGAVALVPRAEFDPDVLRMRDPNGPAARAFEDLLAQNDVTSPWFANVVAPDLAAADALAAELRSLDAVSRVLTLSDYVPSDQEEKRLILDDVAFFFDVPDRSSGRPPKPGVAEQVSALTELRDFLAQLPVIPGSELGDSVRRLRFELDRFLSRVEREGDAEAALASLEQILLGGLPRSLDRLRTALAPDEVELASLPPQLARRMLTSDGQARIQIFPRENLNQELALERFVDAIRRVAPDATGLAVNVVSFGHVTVESLRQALASAVVAIALLLFALWRRVTEMLLVLAPLVLGAALTTAAMVLLDVHFNFANVIVIPLMLGMGVDSGIHLVHRARSESLGAGRLLGTTTARAVLFSAFTTLASFGSLALSSHRGMQSLGVLLVVGLLFTLLAKLVVLPALLAWRRPAEEWVEASEASESA